LIVDDEPVNLQVLMSLLQPYYQVRAANSAHNVLRILDSQPLPDLILLDVMMPDMDGYALLRKIRAIPERRNIPVIFVTALSDESDEQYGFELGAVDYITKPVRPGIVLARVSAHVELKHARDQLKDQNDWLE